jgi:hypothetical protein
MSKRRIKTNTTALYFIAFAVIIVAFLLLGGGPWIKGMMHGSRSMGVANWNWTQILIGFGLGFLLGFIVSKRR